MGGVSPERVTESLRRSRQGDSTTLEKLPPLIDTELRCDMSNRISP